MLRQLAWLVIENRATYERIGVFVVALIHLVSHLILSLFVLDMWLILWPLNTFEGFCLIDFETESLCVALTVLELTEFFCLCLCLRNAGIKVVCQHSWLWRLFCGFTLRHP